ncbi:MAG: glycosyltransferase family 2 protein [Legionellales bacterium]|nr:glycosyltransferase family 2 protein [Legionellales bacterium]
MSTKKIDITVVTPVYQAIECLDELYSSLTYNLREISDKYEIIMVNDGSIDNSWERIQQLADTDDKLIGINLSRNFGQHVAISCGINYANGDYVVVIDCDLQDHPDEIKNLYAKAKEGYDIVFARRINKKFSTFKKLTAKLFKFVFNKLADIEMDEKIGTYSIVSKKVVKEIKKFSEIHRCYPILLNWLGFKNAKIDIIHKKRYAGSSSYNFFRSLRLGLHNIVSFSNKPLTLFIYLGFFITCISMGLGIKFLLEYWIFNTAVTGHTSLIVSLFFLGGIIIAFLGILGIYVGNIFAEVKRRPLYVVSEEINNKL